MSEPIEHAYSQIENIDETLKSFKKTIDQYLHSLQQEITRSQLFINTITICKDHYLDEQAQMTFHDLLHRAKQLHAEFESCQSKPSTYSKQIEQYLKSFDQCEWISRFRKIEQKQDDPAHTVQLSSAVTELNAFEKELKGFFMEMDLNLEAQNQALLKLRKSYQALDDKLFGLINPPITKDQQESQGSA